MGRHSNRKESFILGLLKLALLAAILFALLFVVCRLYPEKIPPNVLHKVETVTTKAYQLKSLPQHLLLQVSTPF